MNWLMMSLSSAVILSPSLGPSSAWPEEAVCTSLMLLWGVVSSLSPKFSKKQDWTETNFTSLLYLTKKKKKHLIYAKYICKEFMNL